MISKTAAAHALDRITRITPITRSDGRRANRRDQCTDRPVLRVFSTTGLGIYPGAADRPRSLLTSVQSRDVIGWTLNSAHWTSAQCLRCRLAGRAGLLDWEPCGAPCLKATFNVRRAGKAQLLQCRRRQAGLITLVAEQDDVIIELRCAEMAELTGWVQPPFQDVSGNYERSRDDAIAGDLRIRADVDQGRPSAHCLQRLGRIEPGQPAPCICQ